MKKHKIDFDMKAAHTVVVSAKSLPEAKRKAFRIMVAKLRQRHFNIETETE